MKLILLILQFLTLAVHCAKMRGAANQLAMVNMTEVSDADIDMESDMESESDENEEALEASDAEDEDEADEVEEADEADEADDDVEDEAEDFDVSIDDREEDEVPDEEADEMVEDASEDMTLAAVNASQSTGATEVKDIPGVGKVLIRKKGKESWVLLMKLSKNNFCYHSRRWLMQHVATQLMWHDGQAFRPKKMLDEKMPRHQSWDAKSIAFHHLKGIDAIKLQTNTAHFDKSPEVHFKHASTAENLMTTNNVDIIGTGNFNTKKYWDEKWKSAYKPDRNRAPAFMRAEFVQSTKPECRTNPQDRPSGCGKKCMFCFQSGDGHGCPVRSAHNDVSSGIGLNRKFCGGGNGHDCSSSGNWAGNRRTMVWGRLRPGYKSVFSTYTMDYGGDVLVRHDGGESWALVMKLSKNDFCYGSSRWTDGKEFKPEKMFDIRVPKHQEYDAKSLGFHKLAGVTALKIQTNRQKFSSAVTVEFEEAGTPEELMTSNKKKISTKGGFNKKKWWRIGTNQQHQLNGAKWEKQYGNARERSPAFMRAGKFVEDPSPQCRTNPQDGPSGCGKPCVFCMQAGDGHGCPAKAAHNDVSIGIGLNSAFCGGGNKHDCSSSGNWVGDSRTLVWAKWSCEKHAVGQCKGEHYYGSSCGELEVDDCDTHYIHVKTGEAAGTYLQCVTVGGQCVAKGPACYGSCANAALKH